VITTWRITKAKFAATAFDGHAAAKFPGRWNPSGVRAAYTAENRSLAALEVLANAEDKDTLLSARWSIIPVRIDPDLIYAPEKFPADWRSVPPSDSTRRFGADWVTKGTSAVLRVPSIVTLGEFCYVLNPLHPDFAKLDIGRAEPFTFDARTA